MTKDEKDLTAESFQFVKTIRSLSDEDLKSAQCNYVLRVDHVPTGSQEKKSSKLYGFDQEQEARQFSEAFKRVLSVNPPNRSDYERLRLRLYKILETDRCEFIGDTKPKYKNEFLLYLIRDYGKVIP